MALQVLFFFLSTAFVLSNAAAAEDPKLWQCLLLCVQQKQYDMTLKGTCQHLCLEYASRREPGALAVFVAMRTAEAVRYDPEENMSAWSMLAAEDPELWQCLLLCVQQKQYDITLKRICQHLCLEYAKEKEERAIPPSKKEEPEAELHRCKHQCRQAAVGQHKIDICEHKCEEKYKHNREGDEGSFIAMGKEGVNLFT